MKNKDAIRIIKDGADIEMVKEQYIKDVVDRINYDNCSGIVRKDTEKQFVIKRAELDFCYYVFWKDGKSYAFLYNEMIYDLLDFDQFTALYNIIEKEMQIETYNECKRRDVAHNWTAMFDEKDDKGKSRIDKMRENI